MSHSIKKTDKTKKKGLHYFVRMIQYNYKIKNLGVKYVRN